MKRTPEAAPFWRRHLKGILGSRFWRWHSRRIRATDIWPLRRSEEAVWKSFARDRRLKQENHLCRARQRTQDRSQAIEKIAREEMGLAKTGEMIFKLPAAAAGTATSTARYVDQGKRGRQNECPAGRAKSSGRNRRLRFSICAVPVFHEKDAKGIAKRSE